MESKMMTSNVRPADEWPFERRIMIEAMLLIHLTEGITPEALISCIGQDRTGFEQAFNYSLNLLRQHVKDWQEMRRMKCDEDAWPTELYADRTLEREDE